MRIIKSSINKRTSATSFPYKGHRIKLLTDGSGYAIYDARGELEDSGFRTAQDAKKAIDEYDSIYQDPVTSSTDDVLAGAYKQDDSIIIDAEDLRGKSREEIEEILKDAPVGSEIIHIRNTSNRFNIDTRIEKQQHYSSNYHQGFSSPHDWKTLNEFWAVGGREDPYIDKTIYESVNGKNKYYGLTSDVLKAHRIDQPIDESTSVEASDSYNLDDKLFIEDIIDGLEDNGYDLNDLSSIKEGLWALFGYQGKDADDVIEDLVAGGFVDSNVLIDSGRKSIYSDTEEDGEGYWFFTTHGVQPGSVPRDVDILDIIDTPNGSFVKFDRFLSTEELNKYDMKERAPKSVMSAEAVELDPEESMIDMNIDQYIIVDSEGSWNYDSDNYDWASSDGEGSDWYSDNGVRLDDPTGVVEKIDELIEPHIPIEPGTYRVQGYIELYYTVSGVYENRYDYTSDDYSSDINSDLGSAEYNNKLSKIEDIKVTKI